MESLLDESAHDASLSIVSQYFNAFMPQVAVHTTCGSSLLAEPQ